MPSVAGAEGSRMAIMTAKVTMTKVMTMNVVSFSILIRTRNAFWTSQREIVIFLRRWQDTALESPTKQEGTL